MIGSRTLDLDLIAYLNKFYTTPYHDKILHIHSDQLTVMVKCEPTFLFCSKQMSLADQIKDFTPIVGNFELTIDTSTKSLPNIKYLLSKYSLEIQLLLHE